MKKFILCLIFTMCVHSTIYENSEDNKTNGWSLYKSEASFGTIKNIYDKDIDSRVILLDNKKQDSGYLFELETNSTEWQKKGLKTIEWSIKSSEDFNIFVSLQTIKGHRSLIYTSSTENGWGYYGLGSSSTDGRWHRYSREIDKELKSIEPNNKIIAIDRLFIRGRLMIDDIEIKSDSKSIVKESNLEIEDTHPPTIKLHGGAIESIELGGDYLEKGATAIDDRDGWLKVEISNDIDCNRVGTYSIFYMAKDRAGNSTIMTRTVNVGQI